MELALIEREAISTLDQAKEIVVASDEQYSMAGEFIVNCKSLIAKIKAEFSEPKRKADEAHKSITAMEKRTLDPVQRAMDTASAVAVAYKKEQDRLAKEEADQIAAERRRADEDLRLKVAEDLEAAGRVEDAERVIAESLPATRQYKFESPVPRVAGLSTRKTFKYRITQPGQVKRAYCLPDASLCNRAVQSFYTYNKNPTAEQVQSLIDEIGGGEIYLDEQFAGRRA